MKKRIIKRAKMLLSYILTLAMIMGTAVTVQADTVVSSSLEVSVTESGGWLEAAYIEWDEVSEAIGYNVYIKDKNAEDSSYVKIDNELIRQYSTYWRADALGLEPGEYVMKVEAVFEDNSTISSVTDGITVAANDRSGFAFSSDSTYGTGSGAYNEDGTLKEGAQVIYITSETAKTVTLDVITSSKGAVTQGVGIGHILTLRQKGYDNTPLAIRFIGQIIDNDMSGQLNGNGYLQVKGKSNYSEMNMTLEGVGQDAYAYGWGFLIRACGNVEIRNMGIMLFPDDGISLDTGNCNIWIHNNDIFYGSAGSDADQVKGDGSADVKGASTFVTLSYNHFWDSGKASLCGMSDTEEFFVTYHHNWFDHSDSRHPRIRVASVHVYNNYFDGNSKYGVGTTKGSSAFVEANYFRNAKYPMMSSMQGTDALGEGTFSNEPGGMIKAFNNSIEGATSLIYANSGLGTTPANEETFDAYLASTRDELVPDTYQTVSGGTKYNNFDANKDLGVMESSIDDTSNVIEVVTTYAGRMNGGDFIWNFNNDVDDVSYDVNEALMSEIRSYTTKLTAVGGNVVDSTEPTDPTNPTDPKDPTNPSENEIYYVHNFTENGKESDFFSITGNLSTSKGTVTYNDLTLTQCLKLESSTSIAFTTTGDSTLKLVFDSASSKNIKVDGTKYTLTNGIFELELKAGSHTITKADTANLFYMSVYGTDSSESTDPTDPVDPSEPTDPTDPEDPIEIGDLTSTGATTNLFNKEDSYFTNVIYVSKDGTSNGTGIKTDPYDLVTAIEASKSIDGATILLMGGTYTFDSQITIDLENNGTEDAYKVLKACKGEEVTLDFSSQEYSSKDTSLNERGIQLNGSYWYVQGITIYGAADNGMMISGSHNIIEYCVFDSNRDTGLQISRRSASVTNYDEWPAYNQIINSTSKNNCDPASYENADGFAAKLTCGPGNVFDGCIAYNNSDDGWDLYAKTATGPIGIVTIKNSIAMRNGKTESGLTNSNCDGNGFKLGGSGVGTPHVVINALAIENLHHGFTDNNNPSAIAVVNATAFDNNQGGSKNNFSLYRCKEAYVANTISYTTNNTSDKYVNLNAEYTVLYNSSKWYQVTKLQAMDTGKSATRGTVLSKGITAEDFRSVSVPSVGANFHKVWRNTDGTINTKGVAIISETSDHAKFSTDGSVIGARFSFDNNTKVIEVSISLDETQIPGDAVQKPVASLESGRYMAAQVVELSTTTEDTVIYYTTNGEIPTTSSTEYVGEINVDYSMTIKAIAVKEGMKNSDVSEFEYIINYPSVTSVIVSPSKTSVQKGSSQKFNADVVVENGAEQSVNWSLEGGTDSDITSEGLLEVGSEETAANLTIIATSTFDDSKMGVAEVTVAEVPIIYYNIVLQAEPEEGGTVFGGGEIAAEGYTTIVAIPNDHYTFKKWMLDDMDYTTTTSSAIYVDSDKIFTAVFELAELEKIEVTTEPTNTIYVEGDRFNPDGMVVTATYSDGTIAEVIDYTYTPNGNLETSDRWITIIYGGKTAEVEIIVNEQNEQTVQHTIIASAGVGGDISPNGSVSVLHGTNKTFTIIRNSGYYISSVIVDGMSVGVRDSYTFSNIEEDHTIKVLFEKYDDSSSEADDDDVDEDEDEDEDTTPGSIVIVSTPTIQTIKALETTKKVENSIARGETPVISLLEDSGRVEISKDTLAKLKESGSGLIIDTPNRQLGLANKIFNQLMGGALSVHVSNLEAQLYNRVKTELDKDSNIALIGDKKLTTELIIKLEEKVVTKVDEPVTIMVDLTDVLKQVSDFSKLTLARVIEVDGVLQFQKVGGMYDSKTKTFTAHIEEMGQYVLIECADIQKINLTLGSQLTIINGVTKMNDIAPVVVDGRTMVPLRFIVENFGGEIKWDKETKEITISITSTELKMQIGTVIEGYGIAPFIQNDRTLVPLRYVAETIGANVVWIPSMNTIEIVK